MKHATYEKTSPGARTVTVRLDRARGAVLEGRRVAGEDLGIDIHPTRFPRLLAMVIGRVLKDDGYRRVRLS